MRDPSISKGRFSANREKELLLHEDLTVVRPRVHSGPAPRRLVLLRPGSLLLTNGPRLVDGEGQSARARPGLGRPEAVPPAVLKAARRDEHVHGEPRAGQRGGAEGDPADEARRRARVGNPSCLADPEQRREPELSLRQAMTPNGRSVMFYSM